MRLHRLLIPFLLLPFLAFSSACGDDKAPSTPDTEGLDDTANEGDLFSPEDDATDDALGSEDAEEPPSTEARDLLIRPEPGTVVLSRVTSTDELISGGKTEGQIGDYILQNNVARFLVQDAVPRGGYRQFGGALVDADFYGGAGDLLGELWLGWNLYGLYPEKATVLSNGDNGEAILRLEGRTAPFQWIFDFLRGLPIAPEVDLYIAYEYRLLPDSNSLELRVIIENDQTEEADLSFPIIASNHGDGAFVFSPGPGFTEAREEVPWLGAIGVQTSYGFLTAADDPPQAMIQATNVQISATKGHEIEAGGQIELNYVYVLTQDGTTGIEKERGRRFGLPTITLRGQVEGIQDYPEEKGAYPPSHTLGKVWVTAVQESQVLGFTPVHDDGSFELVLPESEFPYEIEAHAPERGSSDRLDVSESQEDIVLSLPALGELVVSVKDQDGDALPAQVSVFRIDAPSPFAPSSQSLEIDWGNQRSTVLYHVKDQVSARLLPGRYQVVASRGYSYELDEGEVVITENESTELSLMLEKVVNTDGWTAADLHIHSFWSPDADVPYIARLRQSAANDIGFPVSTEHTYIGNIHAHREAAMTDEWVSPILGQEVTSLIYGHFNAYPLVYDRTKPSFGAVFEHGYDGTGLFEAIRQQNDGNFLYQVNHARNNNAGQNYFHVVGLDSKNMTVEHEERWSTDFDNIELFNSNCLPNSGNEQVIQDWYNFNDHGLIKGITSGTDTHWERVGIGRPRTWLPTTIDEVNEDIDAFTMALKNRRGFITCGPFVRFETTEGDPMGSMVAAENGKLSFFVEVSAPSWVELESVQLLENGVPIFQQAISTWEAPEGLSEAIRFQGEIEVSPEQDAWYIVEVIGKGNLWPLYPNDRPHALTNIIQVDHDADGLWIPPAETGTTRHDHIDQGTD